MVLTDTSRNTLTSQLCVSYHFHFLCLSNVTDMEPSLVGLGQLDCHCQLFSFGVDENWLGKIPTLENFVDQHRVFQKHLTSRVIAVQLQAKNARTCRRRGKALNIQTVRTIVK